MLLLGEIDRLGVLAIRKETKYNTFKIQHASITFSTPILGSWSLDGWGQLHQLYFALVLE